MKFLLKKLLFSIHFFVLFFLIIIFSTQADETDIYDFSWLDADKEVYVLQNRKFRKDGNLYISAGGQKTLSGAFFDGTGYNLRGGFFFTENWGLELGWAQYSGQTNSNYEGVDNQAAIAFYRYVSSAQTAHLMWSPFYAKINTFNTIFYYDWIFGLGFANVVTKDNRDEFGVNPSDDLTTESQSGISWQTGIRFYLTEMVSLRLDVVAIHFQADLAKQDESQDDELKKTWFHNYDLNLGLNLSF
jgi:outer membrane beta-barrel protein